MYRALEKLHDSVQKHHPPMGGATAKGHYC
jgi:hypothetical protein